MDAFPLITALPVRMQSISPPVRGFLGQVEEFIVCAFGCLRDNRDREEFWREAADWCLRNYSNTRGINRKLAEREQFELLRRAG